MAPGPLNAEIESDLRHAFETLFDEFEKRCLEYESKYEEVMHQFVNQVSNPTFEYELGDYGFGIDSRTIYGSMRETLWADAQRLEGEIESILTTTVSYFHSTSKTYPEISNKLISKSFSGKKVRESTGFQLELNQLASNMGILYLNMKANKKRFASHNAKMVRFF
jgi:hypothetical protein